MKITKTVSIKLKSLPESISDTFTAYINALNYISQIAIKEKTYNPFRLQEKVYHQVRKKFKLKSQMTVNAIRLVSSVFKSNFKKKKKFNQPHFNKASILLNFPRDFKIIDLQYISINTIYGRQKVELAFGDYQKQYLNGSWQIGSGHLIKRKKEYFFNISVSKEIPDIDIKNTIDVIGVDLGQRNIAVVSAPNNKCKFFKGGEIKHKKEQFRKVRSGLQSKGTCSSKRVLKRISGQERRYQTDINHKISKQIVQFAKQYNKPIIVMEDLKGIRETAKQRKKQRYFFHSWAFSQLQNFIEYKAQIEGIPVFKIDPAYTSQICLKCGHLTKSNGLQFVCSYCHYSLHRDLLGSRNISNRFILDRQDLIKNGVQSTTPEVMLSGNCKPTTLVVGS